MREKKPHIAFPIIAVIDRVHKHPIAGDLYKDTIMEGGLYRSLHIEARGSATCSIVQTSVLMATFINMGTEIQIVPTTYSH